MEINIKLLWSEYFIIPGYKLINNTIKSNLLIKITYSINQKEYEI